VFEIARKWFHCIDLVVSIPTQLEWAQTESVWQIYDVLSVFPNVQNLLTVQFVYVDVAADCIVRTTVQMMWQGHLAWWLDCWHRGVIWQKMMWTNRWSRRGMVVVTVLLMWTYCRVPHGTPLLCKMFGLAPRGPNPRPPGKGQRLRVGRATNVPTSCDLTYSGTVII